MAKKSKKPSFIKIVYFDEESASDYLDISAGGRSKSDSESIKKRAKDTHAEVETKISAKLSWLPFFGVSGDAGLGASASAGNNSILRKTLSNTILTDYLSTAYQDQRLVELENYNVVAKQSSMAYLKMYTPYTLMIQSKDLPIDLSRLDEILRLTKGYYELIATNENGDKHILRFNINAFRNNYGLTDLMRMNLVFHGVRVGKALEENLTVEAEMNVETDQNISGTDLALGLKQKVDDYLLVYDIILAGVKYNA